jgi:cardiolipin synthase
VDVHAVLPGGLRWRRSGRMDLRNHRKIAVFDNAWPMWVRRTWPRRVRARQAQPRAGARVRGPAVAHLEAVFASDWYMETGQRLDVIADVPCMTADIATQLLPSGPAYPYSNARDAVAALIHLARRRLVMVTPYFVPDEATLSALRIAAVRRGGAADPVGQQQPAADRRGRRRPTTTSCCAVACASRCTSRSSCTPST